MQYIIMLFANYDDLGIDLHHVAAGLNGLMDVQCTAQVKTGGVIERPKKSFSQSLDVPCASPPSSSRKLRTRWLKQNRGSSASDWAMAPTTFAVPQEVTTPLPPWP